MDIIQHLLKKRCWYVKTGREADMRAARLDGERLRLEAVVREMEAEVEELRTCLTSKGEEEVRAKSSIRGAASRRGEGAPSVEAPPKDIMRAAVPLDEGWTAATSRKRRRTDAGDPFRHSW